MRKISDSELWRQIFRVGGRFGVVPMKSCIGGTLAAEDISALLPATPGIFYIDRIRRDITRMDSDYPWYCLLRNRKHKPERTASLRAELRVARSRAVDQNRIRDAEHELAGDIRKADKQTVQVHIKR